VVIRVTQRTPVAWTRTVLTAPPVALLDGDGRVLARTAAPPPGLVQVAGVGVAGAPGSHVARTDALRALAALPEALRARVTRLVLRPADGPVLVLGAADPAVHEVQLGSLARVRAKATSALAVRDTLAAQGKCVAVVGVSVPDAPFTTGSC
jgi:Cell division protein FtsQ